VIDDARAKADRQELMDERKYFVGQNNEKLFERYEWRTYLSAREADRADSEAGGEGCGAEGSQSCPRAHAMQSDAS
jgi:hypothetical protein